MKSLMAVIVEGENIDSGFLPSENYMTLNGDAYPIGCYPLKVEEGSCKIDIYSPAFDGVKRLEYIFKDNATLYLVVKVNRSRNVVDAKVTEIALKDLTPENLADVMLNLELADREKPKIDAWKRNNKPTPPKPTPTPSSSSESKPGGGKAIGWGLVIMLIGILGVILCYTGEIEIETTAITDEFALSNLAAYYGAAAIGLLTFIAGLLIRKADS